MDCEVEVSGSEVAKGMGDSASILGFVFALVCPPVAAVALAVKVIANIEEGIQESDAEKARAITDDEAKRIAEEYEKNRREGDKDLVVDFATDSGGHVRYRYSSSDSAEEETSSSDGESASQDDDSSR